jgi:hypothetical protein
MTRAQSRDGQITASKAWQPRQGSVESTEPSDGFEDQGRVGSSPEWIVRKARRIGIPPEIDAEFNTFDVGLTTDEEHEHLRRIAGVESDADFWSRQRARRPHGDTLARMALAVAA